MPKITLNSTNSPLTLLASDLSSEQLLATQTTLVLSSGTGLVLNLPAVSTLNGDAKVRVLNLGGQVTINANGTDLIATPVDNAAAAELTVDGTAIEITAVSGVTAETLPDFWTTPILPPVIR